MCQIIVLITTFIFVWLFNLFLLWNVGIDSVCFAGQKVLDSVVINTVSICISVSIYDINVCNNNLVECSPGISPKR